MMQQWIDEADIQTTDAYDEITYDNTKDYLPADVQAVLNSNVSDDDGNAQTEEHRAKTRPRPTARPRLTRRRRLLPSLLSKTVKQKGRSRSVLFHAYMGI